MIIKYLAMIVMAFMLTACSSSDSDEGVSDLNSSQKASLAELNGAGFQ